MTTNDSRVRQIRVRTLGGRHANRIKLDIDRNDPRRIFFMAPQMGLLDRDAAITIANTLADFVDNMPDEEGVGES